MNAFENLYLIKWCNLHTKQLCSKAFMYQDSYVQKNSRPGHLVLRH